MDESNDVNVKIGADVADLKDKMGEVINTIKGASAPIQAAFDSITAAAFKFNMAIDAMKNVLAGGAMFKDAIAETNHLNIEMEVLSMRIGKSLEESWALADTLDGAGVSADTYAGAIQRMTMKMTSSEAIFNQNGIATRDSTGALRESGDVLQDTIAKIDSMTTAHDKNAAGLALLGRNWASYMLIQRASAEEVAHTQKAHEELGYVVTKVSVESTHDYMKAMNDAGDVMKSVSMHITNAMLPGLTAMGNAFATIGPTVVQVAMGAFTVFRVAMEQVKIVVSALWDVAKTAFNGIGEVISLVFGSGGKATSSMDKFSTALNVIGGAIIAWRTGCEIAIETIKGLFVGLGLYIATAAAMVDRAMHGDWDGVKSVWRDGTAAVSANSAQMADNILMAAAKGRVAIDDLTASWEKTLNIKQPKDKPAPSGGSTWNPEKNDKSNMPAMEAELLQAKIFAIEEGGRKMSKAEEDKFWADKLASLDKADMDYQTILKKQMAARLAGDEKGLAQAKEIASLTLAEKRKIDLEGVTAAEVNAKQMLAMGTINAQQELEMTKEFEAQKLAIAIASVADKADLADGDVVALKKAKDEMLDLHRKYEVTVQGINNKMALDSQKTYANMFAPLRTAFDGVVNGILNGTLTLQKAIGNILQSIAVSYAKLFINIAIGSATAEEKQTAAALFGAGQRMGAKAMEAAQSVALTAWAALKNIATMAWEAAAAVYKAIAAIPYVGPFLAPAMAVGASAAVMGFAKSVSSSAGGEWNVPEDRLNFVHKNESILPAHIAAPLRNMVEGGGGMGGGMTVNISAIDAAGVKKFFDTHGTKLVDSLRGQGRAFNTGSAYGKV